MTEKRFELETPCVFTDTLKNKSYEIGYYDCREELLKVLNELAEENEQLKDALNQRTEQCDKYYEENEQLKQQIENMAFILRQNGLGLMEDDD